MSPSSDSDKKERQQVLKQIIQELHQGVPPEKLQKKFRKIIKDTSPEEIADMENALIQEGFPPEDIQKLCDVHAEVFEKALSKVGKPSKIPGHPIHTFIQENKEAKKILKRLTRLVKKLKRTSPKVSDIADFESEFNRLKEIEKHYQRKENQLFPALEEKNFTGPSKVMWGKHDEIREDLKKVGSFLMEKDWEGLYKRFRRLASAVRKMSFLEEKILYPTSARKLSTSDWAKIKRGGGEIGYAWITPSNLWDTELAKTIEGGQQMPLIETEKKDKKIKLDQGDLSREQITLMLKSLPVDITFVDENDKVCFYSNIEDRIFPRSPAVIGREVQNCHPHKSVHIVHEILKSFKDKTKDVAEFWLQKEGKFIHIRYFPVYDEGGGYRGVIEVSQDVTGIRALEGQRRILDW
ncbi:MAG: DUF438 domain-containing protein [Candidatus Aminicenantes bacterium]|jgi:DUF438 domain-containing protein